MSKKVIIIGNSAYTEIVADLFYRDSQYDVCAFTVDRAYLRDKFFCGKPVLAVEDIENEFDPAEYEFFVGIGGGSFNELRYSFYKKFIEKGYRPASFISSKASIANNVEIGPHCFILENVVAHCGCKIGSNVVVFSNTYLGHHTTIGNNCFIASNVSIAGGVSVGNFSYLGAGSSIVNSVTLGEFTMLAMGAICTKSTPDNTFVRMSAPTFLSGAKEVFKKWHARAAAIFK